MSKIKFGFHGQTTSILNTITHLLMPFSAGSLITYGVAFNSTLLLAVGTVMLLPICLFDITFEEQEDKCGYEQLRLSRNE
jgi:accessory gene regulator protein AgrB